MIFGCINRDGVDRLPREFVDGMLFTMQRDHALWYQTMSQSIVQRIAERPKTKAFCLSKIWKQAQAAIPTDYRKPPTHIGRQMVDGASHGRSAINLTTYRRKLGHIAKLSGPAAVSSRQRRRDSIVRLKNRKVCLLKKISRHANKINVIDALICEATNTACADKGVGTHDEASRFATSSTQTITPRLAPFSDMATQTTPRSNGVSNGRPAKPAPTPSSSQRRVVSKSNETNSIKALGLELSDGDEETSDTELRSAVNSILPPTGSREQKLKPLPNTRKLLKACDYSPINFLK